MTTVLVWFGGIITSAIITVLINDSLKYLVARIVGGYSLSTKSLHGIWKGTYDYTTEGTQVFKEHYFRVRQIGKYVVAKTINSGQAYYRLQGKLDHQRFLTGHWYEKTPDRRQYHGAFQLAIRPHGNEMVGKWVGYNRHDIVMSGSWKWQRASETDVEEK